MVETTDKDVRDFCDFRCLNSFWKEAGLNKECVVRWKLFTLENSFILNQVGTIHKNDLKKIKDSFAKTIQM